MFYGDSPFTLKNTVGISLLFICHVQQNFNRVMLSQQIL